MAAPSSASLPGPTARWQAWWRQCAARNEVTALAARHGFVLNPAQLAALGITRQRTRTAVRHERWTAAGRGFVAPVDVRDPDVHLAQRRRHAIRTGAAATGRVEHVVSGRSAAILYGLPTTAVPATPDLTSLVPGGVGRHRTSHRYAATLPSTSIGTWFGLPVTDVARTLVDLARRDRRDALMAADAALRDGLVLRSAIATELEAATGWPGVRRARAILELADPLAESALESLTRLALHDDGFPSPRLQVAIPGTPYRVDMLFDEQRVILEVDGLSKYDLVELRREKRREQHLRALGYRVERVGWDDIILRWPSTRLWLRAALRLPHPSG